MRITKAVFRVLFAATMLAGAPTAVMAESGAPTGDAAIDFLGDTGLYDPSAGGQKLFGTLTVVYTKETRQDCRSGFCVDASWVKNAFINLTLDSGNVRLPFTADYLNGPPSHTEGFWLIENRPKQLEVMANLVKRKVIPFFYRCMPDVARSCPGFKVKAITNFQYTTGLGGVPKDPLSGGFSA